MDKQKVSTFHLVGIAVRTSNSPERGAIDIPQLWNKFMAEDILSQIPGTQKDKIYGVYTDYEGDYTQPYTLVIGCQVDNLDQVPDGMVGISIAEGDYCRFTARGNAGEPFVFNKWVEIWGTPLDRSYKTDMEVYSAKSQLLTDAEVEIYIGVK